MRYFVTGATGFVGGHLVDQLVDAGHDVVALVRPASSATDLPDEVDVVAGDITDKESVRDGMAGADGLFHLAAWYRVGGDDPRTAERVNVEGTRNVLELMDELEIPNGVYTSTLGVFSDTAGDLVDESFRFTGDHLSVYDRTKWEAHYEIAQPMIEDGLPLVIVLPGVVYGPGDRGPTWQLWEPYLRGELPVIPKRTAYCWGHVVDTARAHLLAMEAGEPGEEYIVAGEPYTLVEAFEIAEQAVGIEAPRAIPPAVFRWISRLTGLLERVVPVPSRYRSESLRVLGGATYLGDNAKASRELGLDHRPFADGLGETLRAELARIEE